MKAKVDVRLAVAQDAVGIANVAQRTLLFRVPHNSETALEFGTR